jgi:hypothetical protein
MKAIFELSPLTVLSAHDLPTEAIECSTLAMNALVKSLHAIVETKLNERKFYVNLTYNVLKYILSARQI